MIANLSSALLQKFLERHAPKLEQELAADNDKVRAELRKQLAKNLGPDRKVVTDLEARAAAMDVRTTQLRKELEAHKDATRSVLFDLSIARGDNEGARDRLWNELRKIPDPALTMFAAEVEARRVDSQKWGRTWRTKKWDPNFQTHVQAGNQASLDAYVHALLATKQRIDEVIRAGLDGVAAQSAIAEMRAAWPKIQVGLEEFVIPPAPLLASQE